MSPNMDDPQPLARGKTPAPLIWMRNRIALTPRMQHYLSTIEFLFWFGTATASYLTVFLQGEGMDPAQVGVITASTSFAAIVAGPIWGIVSDKMRSFRKVCLLCLLVASVGWAVIPVTTTIGIGGITLATALIPAVAFFRNPANSLFDGWVVQQSAQQRLNYGLIRAWGSLGFVAMSFLLSVVLPRTGVEITFYFYGLMILPMVIMLWRSKDNNEVSGRKRIGLREMKIGALFRNYYFVTYLIFAIVLQIPLNTSVTFMPYIIQEIGGDSARLGLIIGFRALMEIPVLLMMASLRKRLPLPIILASAASLLIIENIGYFYVGTFSQLMLIQAFHGLGNGILIGAATNYIFVLATDEVKATAQTIHASALAAAGILGSLGGGALMTVVGVRMFFLIASFMILAITGYYIVTLMIGTKLLHKPLPGRELLQSIKEIRSSS